MRRRGGDAGLPFSTLPPLLEMKSSLSRSRDKRASHVASGNIALTRGNAIFPGVIATLTGVNVALSVVIAPLPGGSRRCATNGCAGFRLTSTGLFAVQILTSLLRIDLMTRHVLASCGAEYYRDGYETDYREDHGGSRVVPHDEARARRAVGPPGGVPARGASQGCAVSAQRL